MILTESRLELGRGQILAFPRRMGSASIRAVRYFGGVKWLQLQVVGGVLLVACGPAAPSTTLSPTFSPTTTHSPTTSSPPTTSVTQQTPTATFQEGTIPAVLAADTRFTTLLELFHGDAPALLGFISDERFNGTLFAPTDEAFASLDTQTLEELRNQDVGGGQSGLVLTLQHHVVAGHWRAAQLREREAIGPGETEPPGGHGGVITIEVDGEVIRADGALLIETDLEASNGLIHVIDAVMIPQELVDLAGEPDASTRAQLLTRSRDPTLSVRADGAGRAVSARPHESSENSADLLPVSTTSTVNRKHHQQHTGARSKSAVIECNRSFRSAATDRHPFGVKRRSL